MFPYADEEVLQTFRMVEMENLDIRCVTLGVNLLDCADRSVDNVAEKIFTKLCRVARDLVPVCNDIQNQLGVPIVNKRISVTPIALVASAAAQDGADLTPIAQALDRAAKHVGVDFVGGFSCYVHKGITRADDALLSSIPNALAVTDRVCASVSVASRQAGINVDAVARMGRVIKELAANTAADGGLGCA